MYAPISESSSSNFLIRASIFLPPLVIICETRISENTIISSGLSKWCGAGGWRLGTLTFPKELSYIKDSIRTIASETFTSVSVPIQYAAIKAYTEDHSEFLEHSRLILKTIAEYIHKE
ncbi:aminotransferase class I/II-fold pyridoxal phosphate-dependent enzyme, partial [Candidatus Pseudothioglobus singularis]|nr:aminotransferase class I/II-fold pyridoxal phosphate-dependent enzyme [Candidatus Pseudothioglobus singularis]